MHGAKFSLGVFLFYGEVRKKILKLNRIAHKKA
jgi:hypothetical protein